MKHDSTALIRPLLPLLLATPALALGGGESEAEGLDLEPLQEAAPGSDNGFLTAVKGGDYWLTMRLRWESVDQKSFTENANALTLRAVLGYRTGRWHNLSGTIELEAIQAYVTDYNSLVNGKTQYPVVADPQIGEINQGTLNWNYVDSGEARIGRREIRLDNERFVGPVGWRQDYQSYDAASLEQTFAEHGNLFLAWIDNVNTVVGDGAAAGNEPMASVVANGSWNFENWGVLSGYLYDLDYNATADPRSASTVGGRFNGAHGVTESTQVSYTLEYAAQTETGDNPNNVDSSYVFAKLGGGFGPVDVALAYEVLGGSSNPEGQFQTPLATLHGFNGWADKFLITPQDGLQDVYASVGCKVARWRLLAVYHDFQSDIGSDDYGSEIDLRATWPINEVFAFGAKYANYMEADYLPADDTQKFWLWLSASI